MAPAIPTRTDLSNTSVPQSRGSPIRAGRIPTTPSSMPTANWPKGTSRWPKCRAMYLPASSWPQPGRFGKAELAEKLQSEAELLARRFEEAFWVEELGTYALALDGDKQPCAVRTSNAGQLVFTG